MFTGIVEAMGTIEALTPRGGDVRVRVACPSFHPAASAIGDSIAVNGICLTAVETSESSFAADVSRETLASTTLGDLTTGDPVNLERSLTLSKPLGGHLVTGHVDGVGAILAARNDGRSVRYRLRAPSSLARYVARKGSICIDGISLTVNEVDGAEFEVNIVPHTLEVTNVTSWRNGARVNLEVDIVARYLERLLVGDVAGGVTLEKLVEYGFAKSH